MILRQGVCTMNKITHKTQTKEEQRRKIYLPAILMALLTASILLCGCSALFKEPTVTVGAIELADINATDLSLDITLNIDNPNLFGVMFKKITADVSCQNGNAWEPISHIEKEDIDIDSGSSSVVIPVSAKNADIIKAGFRLLTVGEITIQVTGVAEPSFFGISPQIPFSETRTIPLKL